MEVVADHQGKAMVEEQQELVDQKVLDEVVMPVLMDLLVLEEEVLIIILLRKTNTCQ